MHLLHRTKRDVLVRLAAQLCLASKRPRCVELVHDNLNKLYLLRASELLIGEELVQVGLGAHGVRLALRRCVRALEKREELGPFPVGDIIVFSDILGSKSVG